MKTLPPTERILRDAAARREALAAQWLSAAQVSARLGSPPESGGSRAAQFRRKGEVLGVYVTRPAPSYRYPTWQFCSDGQPVEHLAEILRALRAFGPFQCESVGLRRSTGWGEVEWFLSPHALLNGNQPAEVLTVDPARVLGAVRIEFESGH